MVDSGSKAPFALVTAAIVAVFTVLALTHSWVGDDCFISFRYARNFADGLGLRYNVGVEPPVEGYSEFAWVLWLAIFAALDLDPTLWARASGYAAGLALLLCVIAFARRLTASSTRAAAAAGLSLASAPTMVLWTTGGMGTMAFALAVFVACERLLGDPDRPRTGQATIASVAALLLRADGFYWVAMVLGVAFVQAWFGRRRALLRSTFVCAAVIAVVAVAHTGWRLSYYGDWMPNTARAKVALSAASLHRGWLYLLHFWLTVPATAIVLAIGAWRARRPGETWLRISVGIAAGTFLYGVVSSGDFMPMGRFFLPALPFLALILARIVQQELALGRRVWSAVLTGLVLVASVPPLANLHLVPRSLLESVRVRQHSEYRTEREFWQYEVDNARRWSDLGRALARHAEPGSSLVRGPIGAVGYYSNLVIYDTVGLVNREVIEKVPPKKRSTPGHDRAADPSFFASYDPTYSQARMVYVFEGKKAIGRVHKLAEEGEIEAFRVHRADGFLDDGMLVLRRFGGR